MSAVDLLVGVGQLERPGGVLGLVSVEQDVGQVAGPIERQGGLLGGVQLRRAEVLLGPEQVAPLRGEETTVEQHRVNAQQVAPAPSLSQRVLEDPRRRVDLAGDGEGEQRLEAEEYIARPNEQAVLEGPQGQGHASCSGCADARLVEGHDRAHHVPTKTRVERRLLYRREPLERDAIGFRFVHREGEEHGLQELAQLRSAVAEPFDRLAQDVHRQVQTIDEDEPQGVGKRGLRAACGVVDQGVRRAEVLDGAVGAGLEFGMPEHRQQLSLLLLVRWLLERAA